VQVAAGLWEAIQYRFLDVRVRTLAAQWLSGSVQ